MVERFVLHKDSISLILAITHVPVTAHFMYVSTREKNVSQSLNNVWQWSLEGKRVSLHNLNTRTLLMFKFDR